MHVERVRPIGDLDLRIVRKTTGREVVGDLHAGRDATEDVRESSFPPRHHRGDRRRGEHQQIRRGSWWIREDVAEGDQTTHRVAVQNYRSPV